MADFSTIDPQTMAQQMAAYDIMTMQTVLQKQNAALAAQKTGLESLRTALTDFRTALTGLNGVNSGLLQNSVTMNRDGVASVTANSDARKGTYNIDVEQLASAQQLSYDELTDDVIKNASGEITLTLGEGVDAKNITLDLSTMNSLGDLADAINHDENNPGVTASLVRTDGSVSLMLSSDESGAKNSLHLDASKVTGIDPALFDKTTEIAKAQDAKFKMGDKEFTNSTNTLDNLIDGVTVQLLDTTEQGKPLIINIGTDSSGTQTQVQTFVDAFNTLRDTLGKLTARDGAFYGDSTMTSLNSELNSLLRTTINGHNITDFGITADKDGKLQIDSKKFEAQLKSDPQSLTAFFNGDGGMLDKLDSSLDRYLSSTNGLLKGRQETLDRKQSDIDSKTDAMNSRYDTAYNRYLKQFSQLQQTMTQMNNTMSMFGLI